MANQTNSNRKDPRPNLGHVEKDDRLHTNKNTPAPTELLEEKKLTLKEAAELMCSSVTSLQRIIRDGELPVIKLGGKTLILARDAEAYLQNRYGRMHEDPVPRKKRGRLPAAIMESEVLTKV